MPGRFWFEIRGTEKYRKYVEYPKILKMDGQLDTRYKTGTDYKTPVYVTLEEYTEYLEGGFKGPSIYIERETEKLQRVDEIICEFLGDPKPSIKRDSPGYHMCHDSGFWTLYRMGGSCIEEKHVNDMIERQTKFWIDKLKWSEGKIGRFQMLIRWVFLHKWVYQATG